MVIIYTFTELWHMFSWLFKNEYEHYYRQT